MADASSQVGSDSSGPSDRELIRQFRAGHDQALEILLERYETPLYQFLLGMLRNPELAEDALQDIWCRALEHLDSIEWDHLRGWLFTVAYHQAMLIKRKQKNRRPAGVAPDTLPDAAVVEPASELGDREELERLRGLIDRLPSGQREVIRQRIYEGKRFRDIAEALGCPLNTALARMHEGVKRLRLLWGTTNDG